MLNQGLNQASQQGGLSGQHLGAATPNRNREKALQAALELARTRGVADADTVLGEARKIEAYLNYADAAANAKVQQPAPPPPAPTPLKKADW